MPSRLCRLCSHIATVLCYILVVLTLPISAWFTFKTVKKHERLVVFRLGRLLSTKEPGLVVILPCIDKCYHVDLRTKAFSVPPQKIMTGDNAAIEAGCEVYYHIKDAVLSVYNVQDLNHSTRLIAQTSLQKHLSKHWLSHLQSNKNVVIADLQDDINQMTLTWGVKVEKIDMSEISVISQPNALVSNASNPLSFLGPMLFPPGQKSMPLEQLQQQLMKQMSSGQPGNSAQPPAPMMAWGTDSTVEQAAAASSESHPLCKPKFVSAEDLMTAVQPYLTADLVREFHCTYQFLLTGETAEKYFLDLKNGTGSAEKGELPSGDPDVTLTMTHDDLSLVLREELNMTSAYMTGRLDVQGEIQSARKLGDLVQIIKDRLP